MSGLTLRSGPRAQLAPDKSSQVSGTDKVLCRGRSGRVLEQVLRARVTGRRLTPELSR